MHQIMQDINQIRSICQQLAYNERQNAQMLSQSYGNASMGQRESQAASQLEQCVRLCNHMEQEIQQMQSQNMHQTSSYGQMQNNQQWMQQPMQHANLSQVMQADRQNQYQMSHSYGYGGPTSVSGYMQPMNQSNQYNPNVAKLMNVDQQQANQQFGSSHMSYNQQQH